MAVFLQSGVVSTQEFRDKKWDGIHYLSGVFAVQFPFPQHALSLQYTQFNNDSIYLVEVKYPDGLSIFVVSASRPAGRTNEEELRATTFFKKKEERAANRPYSISLKESEFGSTLCTRHKDVALGDTQGPFPLHIGSYLGEEHSPIQSLSVHRHFPHLQGRIEVAAFQPALGLIKDDTEAGMTEFLSNLADQVVTSMHEYTQLLFQGEQALKEEAEEAQRQALEEGSGESP